MIRTLPTPLPTRAALPRLSMIADKAGMEGDAAAMREALEWLQAGAPSRAAEVLKERLAELRSTYGVN